MVMMKKLPIVRDYMATRLLTLKPDTEILEAAAVLLKHQISGAPVVDDQKRLVGMLSEQDCLRLVAAGVDHDVPHGLVEKFMSREVESITPEMDLYYVAGLFLKKGYRRFPVVQKGVLVGQISRRDLLRAILHHLS